MDDDDFINEMINEDPLLRMHKYKKDRDWELARLDEEAFIRIEAERALSEQRSTWGYDQAGEVNFDWYGDKHGK